MMFGYPVEATNAGAHGLISSVFGLVLLVDLVLLTILLGLQNLNKK